MTEAINGFELTRTTISEASVEGDKTLLVEIITVIGAVCHTNDKNQVRLDHGVAVHVCARA